MANLAKCDSQQVFKIVEEFICQMYSMKKITTVKKPTTSSSQSSKISDIPPCQSELHQQILRASYISNIWRNAHSKYPTIPSPVDRGWENVDGQYEFRRFEADQLPRFVNEVVIQPD